jgi:hypothetical protein
MYRGVPLTWDEEPEPIKNYMRELALAALGVER